MNCDKRGGFDVTFFNEAQAKLSFANSSYPCHVLLKDQQNKTVHWGLSAKGPFTLHCSGPQCKRHQEGCVCCKYLCVIAVQKSCIDKWHWIGKQKGFSVCSHSKKWSWTGSVLPGGTDCCCLKARGHRQQPGRLTSVCLHAITFC